MIIKNIENKQIYNLIGENNDLLFIKKIIKLTHHLTRTTIPKDVYNGVIGIKRGGIVLSKEIAYRINSEMYITNQGIKQNPNKCIISLSNNTIKVLILDVIIDSGKTICELLDHLDKHYPKLDTDILSLFITNKAIKRLKKYSQINTLYKGLIYEEYETLNGKLCLKGLPDVGDVVENNYL